MPSPTHGCNSHTSASFRNLKLLKFPDLLRLKEYKKCQSRFNNTLPEFFCDLLPVQPVSVHSHQTRHISNFRTPLVHHEFAKMSFKYR